MTVPATSKHETPVFVQAGDNTLFGIHTAPTAPSRGIGVVLLHGGSYTWSAHRNQLWLRIARTLAASGFDTLRFDYHGIGDSTGVAEEFRMDRLFAGDALAAVDWMRGRGLDRFVLVGECFGARTALAAAGDVDGLAGLFLIAPQLRDGRQSEVAPQKFAKKYGLSSYLRRGLGWSALRRLGDADVRRTYRRLAVAKLRFMTRRLHRRRDSEPNSAISAGFLDPLEAAVDRGAHIHLVFGTRDGNERFQAARAGRLGEIMDKGSIEFALLEGKVHAELTKVATQDAVFDLITEWAPRVMPTPV